MMLFVLNLLYIKIKNIMKINLKKYLPLGIVGVVSAATTFGGVAYLQKDKTDIQDLSYFRSSHKDAHFASVSAAGLQDDFVSASKNAVPAVVTVRQYSNRRSSHMDQDLMDLFFGGGERQQRQESPMDKPSGFGSGVIISPDGYIITNNHVIEGASKIDIVTSDKRTISAKLIGTDPSTDIALIKVDEKQLPYLNFSNSDQVEVGQWVLAVGNPLGLNSTVTAGIVSAKGRSIDLLRSKSGSPLESFIQTDAAINKGNSGGALINIKGDLVGINSAISSTNGYYVGYGFAVPSNLAKKVVEDIKKFGMVQRGFLGINFLDASDDQRVKYYNKQFKTNYQVEKGAIITEIAQASGAADAGLKKGDIIKYMDNIEISSEADISMAVGSKRPGDEIKVQFVRDGQKIEKTVTLKDRNGGTKVKSKEELSVAERLGTDFRVLTEKEKTFFGIEHGLMISSITQNSVLYNELGLYEGVILLEVNGKPLHSLKDLENILGNYKGKVSLKYLDDNGRLISRGFKFE
jgi:serine protease Do